MSNHKNSLWKLYNRPQRPEAWTKGGTLPWHEPAFAERMLREHLDDSHGTASRTQAERALQIDWLWHHLELQTNSHLFDITCGPGLYAVEFAKRGCQVTGNDISPVSISYARDLAKSEGVPEKCHFVEQDIQQMDYTGANFDAALLLYGQLAVFPKDTAQTILNTISDSLRSWGRLCLEMLNPNKIDKTDSTWWFTDDSGLWGDTPFLHLGERFWDPTTQISTERYQILDLASGGIREIFLSDQLYEPGTMTTMLMEAGFSLVTIYPAWKGISLYDAEEWLVYVAEK